MFDPLRADRDPQIFVDDTDPSIKYGVGWNQLNFDASNASQFQTSHLYDTAHVAIQESGVVNFSYTFTGSLFTSLIRDVYGIKLLTPSSGSQISALFLSTTLEAEITTCTMDGQKATIVSDSSQPLLCGSDPSGALSDDSWLPLL
ncbi:hypothetical protein CPB84DRAFT_1852029 [Gymnopilus junonius]|uniref:Uncharacterized protein n=1 Tax=Gymnopilus junonius TaxID=109634 RepID=A0A9P5TH10_GYMJU|nr:hypothetical protein CPB84DRAFT_1852029 [Gymnopilus junonius]